MEKNLKAKYIEQKDEIAKQISLLPEDSYEHQVKSIELSNYDSLEDYLDFLYMSGLILTSIDGYRKENNISDEVPEEAVKGYFITSTSKAKEHYDALLSQKPSKLDEAIYTFMQTKEGYNYLTTQKNRLKSLAKKKKNITTTFRLNYKSLPIKGLDELKQGYYTVNLAELLALKEKLILALRRLPALRKQLLDYSPLLIKKVLTDKYPSNIERTNTLCNMFSLDDSDSYYNEYMDIINRFHDCYELYKMLKVKSVFSKKARQQLKELLPIIELICEEIQKTVKKIIINKYKEILSEFGTYFGTKSDFEFLENNCECYINDINGFINTIKGMLTSVNEQIDVLNYQRGQIDAEMMQIVRGLEAKLNAVIDSPQTIIDKDLLKCYQNTHMHRIAQKMDKDSIDEITKTYGNIADEYVFRIIPIQ